MTIRLICRHGGPAKAAQVIANDLEALGKDSDLGIPHAQIKAKAVEQNERLSLAAYLGQEPGARDIDQRG
jgi:hypothetical protein